MNKKAHRRIIYNKENLRGGRLNKYADLKKMTFTASLISLLIGASAGTAVSALLLSLCSLMFVKLGTVPTAAAPVITGVVGAVGAFCAGYMTVKLFKSRGLLMGALAGLMFFLSVLLGAVISGGTNDPASLLPKLAVFLAAGSVGGVIRVNKRVSVKRIK